MTRAALLTRALAAAQNATDATRRIYAERLVKVLSTPQGAKQ